MRNPARFARDPQKRGRRKDPPAGMPPGFTPELVWPQGGAPLTWRRAVLISSVFGLLHGLGFASALSETGLPQTQFVTGLLLFNVGVELGQVLFCGALAVLALGTKRAFMHMQNVFAVSIDHVKLATTCAVGVLSSCWLIERIAGMGVLN